MLLSLLALSATAILPWDTAYIDTQTYIDNLADTVQSASRSFIGPGPILVHFEAEIDPSTMTYYAWEVATEVGFNDIEYRFYETDVDYSFSETGTYYARFVTDNSDNTAGTESETYTIQVTESLLQIPNLITPDSPSGTNQVFKVKYQSLKSFEMYVYNRWGQQLFHTKDPSQGWDGTQGGKPVPTGAYYYLVKAVGTDGIKYNKKGDINVLRVKKVDTTTSSGF
jgi:gliding motility-associated-like protein